MTTGLCKQMYAGTNLLSIEKHITGLTYCYRNKRMHTAAGATKAVA